MFETLPKSRIFIKTLLILEIFIGLAIIAVTWYSQRTMSTFFTETEGIMFTSKLFSAYILGFQLVVSFLYGNSMWAKVWSKRYSENVQLLLSMWLLFCLLIVACGCATIWMLLASADTLSEAAELILLKGIDIYYLNPEWKLLWDKLQYTKECCGVHSYMDWMNATWISESVQDCSDYHNCDPLQVDATEFTPTSYGDLGPSTQPFPQYVSQILAPYACCKHNSIFCYENYIPHKKEDGLASPLPHLNLTKINTNGCFPLFMRHLTLAIHLLFILISFALILDFVICFCTKYLMATNYKRTYQEFVNDTFLFDDDGNALVVIKCPPNVRCITLEESNTYSGSNIPKWASSMELYPCWSVNQASASGLENH